MNDQKKAEEFVEDYGLGGEANEWIHDLQSEAGEVSKEILKASEYGDKEPDFDEDIELEIGDVYFSLLSLANKLGIDLSNALEKAIDKYRERLEETGGPGS